MSANTQNNAPVSTESVVTLNGAQLLQALDFIAPDRDTDPQQLECELTISFADGPAGGGYYCYCTDYPGEGAIMLDAETADDLISSDSDTALTQQTLDDVKAGIPARDAEIEALRKEVEALQTQQNANKVDALPPLNNDLIAILGRPNFLCAQLADTLRSGGQDIAKRAENEQAAVIHFLLGHYLADPAQWAEKANAAIDAARKEQA
jgi:hypothetical protein